MGVYESLHIYHHGGILSILQSISFCCYLEKGQVYIDVRSKVNQSGIKIYLMLSFNENLAIF